MDLFFFDQIALMDLAVITNVFIFFSQFADNMMANSCRAQGTKI